MHSSGRWSRWDTWSLILRNNRDTPGIKGAKIARLIVAFFHIGRAGNVGVWWRIPIFPELSNLRPSGDDRIYSGDNWVSEINRACLKLHCDTKHAMFCSNDFIVGSVKVYGFSKNCMLLKKRKFWGLAYFFNGIILESNSSINWCLEFWSQMCSFWFWMFKLRFSIICEFQRGISAQQRAFGLRYAHKVQ